MKKIFFTLIACSMLLMVGCKKNPAEGFDGVYNCVGQGIYDVSYSSTYIASDTIAESGVMTIALDGKEGNVVVTGDYFSTTGYVKDGMLYLNPESHTAFVGEGMEILGFTFPGVEFTANLTYAAAKLEDGKLTWTAAGKGSHPFTILGQTVTLKADVNYSYTATRKE